jgi:hypothetical protein
MFGTNLILSGHHSGHSPTVLVESEIIPEDHGLELLVKVGVLAGDVLELLQSILEGRRPTQLLKVLGQVVQNGVVGSGIDLNNTDALEQILSNFALFVFRF